MFFRLLHYTLFRRRIILWVSLAFFAAGLLYVLIADRQYRTEALLMPPLEEGGDGLLTAWMAKLNLPSMVVPTTAGSTNAILLVDILESRHLCKMIITSLDLMDEFDAETMDDAVKELGIKTRFRITKTGLIKMSVTHDDPELAVEIALSYIAALDTLSHRLRFTRAGNTMEFISGQIERYRVRLDGTRREIAEFQKANGLINFNEQVAGAIEVAADLKVRTVLARIERDLLRDFARPGSDELKRKEAEYRSLREQLERLVEGDTCEAVFIPLKKLPDLHRRSAALQRDLSVGERIYSFLLQRYEEAGIDMARNTPVVQVVDEPNIPENPAGPPRIVIVLVVTFVGCIWITAVIGVWGWVSLRERSGEEDRAFRETVELVRMDFSAIRRFLRF